MGIAAIAAIAGAASAVAATKVSGIRTTVHPDLWCRDCSGLGFRGAAEQCEKCCGRGIVAIPMCELIK